MGGEQYVVLVFGPKVSFKIKDWMLKFKIVDKTEFSKKNI
jgi:hypothetical protein